MIAKLNIDYWIIELLDYEIIWTSYSLDLTRFYGFYSFLVCLERDVASGGVFEICIVSVVVLFVVSAARWGRTALLSAGHLVDLVDLIGSRLMFGDIWGGWYCILPNRSLSCAAFDWT